MNDEDIEKIFEKLRQAGHGSIIRFDASNSGQPVEGIIFDPGPRRPPGYDSGIFISVPSDPQHIFYFDPEASRKHKRIIIQRLDTVTEETAPERLPEDLLSEFEHIRNAQDVSMGGGAKGEARSKYKGIVELE